MVPKLVFLIGHPGSGKSTFYQLISPRLRKIGLSSSRVNDREFFWQAVQKDSQQKFHRLNEDGSIDVLDLGLYDLQSQLLSQALLSSKYEDQLVFIEYTSPSYQRFIDNFDKGLIRKSHLILFVTSFDTGACRNRLRSTSSEDLDNRQVPEYYLQQCYNQNYSLYELGEYFYKTFVIHNDTPGIQKLVEYLPEAISFITYE